MAKFQCDWCHDGAQTRALASLTVSSITEETDRFSSIFCRVFVLVPKSFISLRDHVKREIRSLIGAERLCLVRPFRN